MNLDKLYIYRITHIRNISHILEYGVTHKNSINSNDNFVPIGDNTLISTRDKKEILNGKRLGDYIPFYFGTRSPMLYVIQNGFNGVIQQRAHNIVYVVSSVQKVLDSGIGFIYSDGHATNNFSTFYDSSDLNTIDKDLDFKAIKAHQWKSEKDLDLKRKKESEFLLEADLQIKCILGFVVYNDYAKNELLKIGVKEKQIKIRASYYY